MNTSLNFGSEFEDICLYKIYEKVEEYSIANVYIRLNKQKFLFFIESLKLNFESYNRTDIVEEDNEIGYKANYSTTLLLAKDLGISYDIEADKNYEISDEDGLFSLEEEDVEYEEDINYVENTVYNIVLYYNKNTKNIVDTFINNLDEYIYKHKKTNLFYTIGINSRGFVLDTHETLELEDMDIPLHYGKNFVSEHESIIDNLLNKTHGLVLLHGLPGTGKTSYVKYIINKLAGVKKVIYVPSHMIQELANPEFISFIQKHKKSILILEDAEFALQKRESEFGAQAVSNLLNITNGLLNDAIKVQVIATFNMDKKNIDDALLRPGRLINEWKFDKLSIADSKELAIFLDKADLLIEQPMSVAEIYSGKIQKKKTKNKIGFDN